MYSVQSVVTILYLVLGLVTAIDYQCFVKRIKIHPSECCDSGFLFNRTRLNKCIKLYNMAEFQEFEGLLENPCISECYYNESGMHGSEIDLKLAVNLFQSNPYLSQQDVEKCVNQANKIITPVIHNPNAELIHDSTTCNRNTQSLSICLEEKIYTNCPKDKRVSISNCTIQSVIDECKMDSISSDQLYGNVKMPISN